MSRFRILSLMLCCPIALLSQDNVRSKVIPVSGDTIQLDTLSIVPSSFSISRLDSSELDRATYRLLPASAMLIWLSRPAVDSVIVSYRTFPFLFTREHRHKSDSIILQTPDEISNPFAIYQPSASEEFFDFGGLDANGSFARGISFGNNQDVVVNSSFNLQLAGKLDNVDVVAAMTDANLPIQPEGNTQQIQEFDRVFIQFGFNEGQQKISAGDLQITRPESYFMNFNKKVAGLQGMTTSSVGTQWTNQATATGALSKGQYARNTFTGEESNQGPYRLRGNDGESFIIVLAGTERVYIDGTLLQRGADRDYVIDYNIGEVIFTPNRLITKDSRIVVELEYSVQYYLRSLFYAGETIGNERWRFRFNFFSEQDAKNQPILESFDDSIGLVKKQRLQEVGDNIDEAFFPGHDSVAFDPNIRMYKRMDTTVGINTYSIFVFSTNPDSAFYRVSFSLVGENKGNYQIQSGTLNGRIYEWIAPVNGVPQGSYEPVILLVTPKRRQMFTAAGEWTPKKGTLISTEMAISNNDLNTLSAINDDDNQGLATRLGAQKTFEWGADGAQARAFIVGGSYEYAGRQFKPLDQYRSIEFVRDWNLQQDTVARDEHLGNVSLTLTLPKQNRLGYGVSTFVRPGDYQGLTQNLSGQLRAAGFAFRTSTRLTTSQDVTQNTFFFRPNVQLAKTFASLAALEVGWIYDGENRTISDLQADTLRNASAQYNHHRAYIQTPDTSGVFLRIEGGQRTDHLPLAASAQKSFGMATLARTVNFTGALQENPSNRLAWNLTYRKLDIVDTNLTTIEAEESYLGRTEYNVNVRKGLLRSTTLYEVGSGRELKREYTFLEVPAGQGTHIWNDNNDDSLQQLYEFEAASEVDLLQADYIRVLTPTSEYISVNVVTFNQVLHIEPASTWRTKPGVRGVIGRLSNSSYVQINRKVLDEAGLRSVNPFSGNIDDTLLVSSATLLRNTFYFNRTAPTFGAEFNVQDNFSKQVLTYGTEERHRMEQYIRARLNLGKRFNTQLQLTNGRQSSSTPAFTINDYNFTIREVEPKITFQEKSTVRLSVLYNYSIKQNSGDQNERALTSEVTADMRYTRVSKSALSSRITYAAILFNGDVQSSLGYAMLAGLKPGNNFVWNVTLERTLGGNFQLSLSYDGRKSEDSPFVHVGSAQVRAVF